MKRRVVVTGMGAITPIGNSVSDFENAMFEMKSGASRITRFDPAELPTRIASEVKGVKSEFRDVKITYAILAAREAMKNAGLDNPDQPLENSVLTMGIGLELFSMSDLIDLKNNGYDNLPEEKVNSLTFLNTPSDICAHLISTEFQLTSSPLLHISACAAGTDALGSGFLKIQSGEVDVALAGGTDSMINPMGVAGFCRIGAMTEKNDSPDIASAPFDNGRDGFVLGEGAAFLVLEEESHAVKRGVEPLAVISGYGNSLDAYSISDPHPEGAGAQKSMRRALETAGLTPDDIDAISAHGTGTIKNDPAEAQAIRSLLGERYKEVPAFSTKSLIGHCISAAGAIEAVAVVLSLRAGKLHATRNLKNIDQGCELCHVMNKPISHQMKHVLKNSFGFGGQNASIVISKLEEL
jgi:3-oxoacyl-[acyl-carrier-protein] synthase II